MSVNLERQPRIAIPEPTFAEADYNERSWVLYAAAVTQAGGEPVKIRLSSSPAEIAKLATSCQGVILPGSPADVNPAKYGLEREEQTAAPDPARENVDELLLQDAHNLHKPLLAICYGVQILNTWRTGTLLQHLMPIPVNHGAGKSVAIAHTVAIEPNSALAEIVGASSELTKNENFWTLPVNSSHHQAIGVPGDGLRVVARCHQDAVVEAVEGAMPGHFVLGLQWHPERSLDISLASRLIFERFVRIAAAWHPRIVTDSLA